VSSVEEEEEEDVFMGAEDMVKLGENELERVI
jgi:hypothetical protein